MLGPLIGTGRGNSHVLATAGDGTGESACTFTTYTLPTPVQKLAFDLLGVKHIL